MRIWILGETVNQLERALDGLDPRLSVRLRLLKKRLHNDIALRIMSAIVKNGEATIDVGANRGVYTLKLSKLVGRSGRVHSFDPVPVNVRSLEGLSRSLSNIVVHPVALSDQTGSARLYIPLQAGHPADALASLVGPPTKAHAETQVDVAVLDDVLDREPLRISFIKCDVEGHEASVLRGGRRVILEQLPALLLEIEQRHRQQSVHQTLDELIGWGYTGYGVTVAGLTPVSDFDVERDQLRYLKGADLPGRAPEGYVGNFLFVRPGIDLRRLLHT